MLLYAQLKPCRVAAAVSELGAFSEADLFCLTGVCRGFLIVDDDFDQNYFCRNYGSITDSIYTDVMTDNLKRELMEGKVSRVGWKPTCVHALGAVEKKDGGLRPITDCKRPIGMSINSYMETTANSFKFHCVDDAVSYVKQGSYCAVTDISSAYRSVSVYPGHRRFQGFVWDSGGGDEYYVDNRLCFGLGCAPYIFNQLSDFCVRLMEARGCRACINYLDDFFVCGPTVELCSEGQRGLFAILGGLGFVVNWKKTSSPSTKVRYLGIEIDTVDMELRLPEDKVARLLQEVTVMMEKQWTSVKAFEKLVGYLAHCAAIVRGSRTFMRRLFNVLRRYKNRRRVCITEACRDDLRWWKKFILVFNGNVKILDARQDVFSFLLSYVINRPVIILVVAERAQPFPTRMLRTNLKVNIRKYVHKYIQTDIYSVCVFISYANILLLQGVGRSPARFSRCPRGMTTRQTPWSGRYTAVSTRTATRGWSGST